MAKIFFFLGVWLASTIKISPQKQTNEPKDATKQHDVRSHTVISDQGKTPVCFMKLPEPGMIKNNKE